MFLHKIVTFLVVIEIILAAHTFKKVLVTDPDALCLDGTKGAYYIINGKQSNKFLLSFQGGGWCESSYGLNQALDICLARSKTQLGSSLNYTDTWMQYAGILSDVPQNYFKDWTIAHLKYCDGTGHQGYKKDPLSYKGSNLYFRGHNVTIAQLNSIDQMNQMFSSASEIVVTGQSAGGLAVFLWTNYIASRASKNTIVRSLPDSGIFLDRTNFVSNTNTYRMGFQNLMKIANQQIDPPSSECISTYPTQKWKCLFGQYLHPFIKVPLFSIQSAYDSWAIHYILGITCPNTGSFAACDQKTLDYIEQYHANTTKVLKEIGSNKNNGFWSPSCSNHVYSASGNYINTAYRIPQGSQFSLAYSIEEWMTNKQVNYQHFDDGNWPINKPCSGLASTLTSQK